MTEESAAPAAPVELVEGPADPLVLKSLATVLTAALLERGWRMIDATVWPTLSAGSVALLGGAVVVVAAGYIEIVGARTRIDGESIRQRSLWSREVRLADITQLKLLQVPGLGWLIVPRLVVRTRGLGLATFRAGDARLLAAFRRLAYGG